MVDVLKRNETLRHGIIVPIKEKTHCGYLELLPFHARCEFVRQTESCMNDVFFIKYFEIIYCVLGVSTQLQLSFVVFVLLLVCAYVFMILGMTADQYFCPCLTVLSHMMGLSEQIAGVTLLAFGNGAPDVFTGITGLHSDSRVIISDMFSADTFVLFGVGGAVILVKPFVLDAPHFLRDSGFLLLALVTITFILHVSAYVNVWKSALYISIYILYIIVVILMHYMATRTIRHIQKLNIRRSLIELEIARRQAVVNPMKAIMRRPSMMEHRRKVAAHRKRQFRAVARAALAIARDSKDNIIPHSNEQGELEQVPSVASMEEVHFETPEEARKSSRKSKLNSVYSKDSTSSSAESPDNQSQIVAKSFAIETAALVMLSRTITDKTRSGPLKPCLTLACLQERNIAARQDWTLLQQFGHSMNPFNEEFRSAGTCSRTFSILMMPISLIVTLLVPVVDYEMPLLGWSKLLNCLQIILLSTTICMVSDTQLEIVVFRMPLIFWVLALATLVTLLIFSQTKVNEMPKYFQYFSILGLIGAIFIIYMCARAIINLLSVIGVATHRSNSFLGCTLLAWGNGIGDLVTNVSMARQGYQRMAFAACLGGPLFNSLIAIGFSYLYESIEAENYQYEITKGLMGPNGLAFLIIGLVLLIFAAIITNFTFRKSLGYFAVTIYVIFIMYAILSEFNVIHPYGSDHKFDFKP